jgi:hypothetical protein
VAQIRGRIDLGVGRAKNVAVAPHRAGTGGAARRRRSIPTRTSHRQRQCMRKRCQDRNRKTAKGATGDERAGNSVPRPIGGSDLEFFRSSARPEPAAYWPSGKRLISDVSANDCHWSFWVVKRANCVPHRREKGHHSKRGCRFRQSTMRPSNQIGNETHQGLGAGAGKEERPHVLQEPGLVSAWTDKQ